MSGNSFHTNLFEIELGCVLSDTLESIIFYPDGQLDDIGTLNIIN